MKSKVHCYFTFFLHNHPVLSCKCRCVCVNVSDVKNGSKPHQAASCLVFLSDWSHSFDCHKSPHCSWFIWIDTWHGKRGSAGRVYCGNKIIPTGDHMTNEATTRNRTNCWWIPCAATLPKVRLRRHHLWISFSFVAIFKYFLTKNDIFCFYFSSSLCAARLRAEMRDFFGWEGSSSLHLVSHALESNKITKQTS